MHFRCYIVIKIQVTANPTALTHPIGNVREPDPDISGQAVAVGFAHFPSGQSIKSVIASATLVATLSLVLVLSPHGPPSGCFSDKIAHAPPGIPEPHLTASPLGY